ncbi:MAG: hypothetical protein ACOYLQ_09570 [Hyphomicrobiaceae bacterium]
MPAADLRIAHVKELLKRIGGRGCVVILFDEQNYAVAEYGRDKSECGRLKRLVDAIVDKIDTGELPAP